MAEPASQIFPAQTIHFHEPIEETPAWSNTASKIQQFFTGLEGILTIFSIAAGTAIAVTWGVPLGLLSAAVGISAAIAIVLCRAPKAEEDLPNTPDSVDAKPSLQPSRLVPTPTVVEPLPPLPPLPIGQLWQNLNRETERQLAGLDYCKITDFGHRYPVNVFCPRETAVGVEIGHPFHANRVGQGISHRAFIASQAPLPEDFEAFWKSTLSENCSIILDLTTGKDQIVTEYYPRYNEPTKTYGSITVKFLGALSGPRDGANGSYYQVIDNEKGTQKTVYRFFYRAWPDFGVVSCNDLDILVRQVEVSTPNPDDLVWVHCRAGVGRTGTLITALILKEKIEAGEVTEENLDASLVEIIVGLRKQRGALFVQQEIQLGLLREYANFLLS